jgi:hypothetical protein
LGCPAPKRRAKRGSPGVHGAFEPEESRLGEEVIEGTGSGGLADVFESGAVVENLAE